MKFILVQIAIVTIVSTLCYPQQRACEFDTYIQKNRHNVEAANNILLKKSRTPDLIKSQGSGNIKIIPAVVHVIHNGGVENISDAQIQSQFDVLYEDYRKIPGTAGDGAGVDTEIQFRLAKKDPQGRCTNGIVRIQSTLTIHKTYQRIDLSKLSSWDPVRYLNIYVVKNISGGTTAGYASFPGGPNDQDGVVVAYNVFGRTGAVQAPQNLGRTATHELGHWLGLYHTFNNGCGVDTCSDGDYVCDTPPAMNPNYGCPLNVNSCINDNLPDLVSDYMDYSSDSCMHTFTAGQAARMQVTLTTLRTGYWSQSNLTATGTDSGYVSPLCNVVADFTSNGDTICVGNSLLFTNKTLNNPTSFQWYFQGGTPSTSSAVNPQVSYSVPGSYTVKLTAYGTLGSDSVEKTNYIVAQSPQAGQGLPFFEGFESPVFPPGNITVDNPDFGVAWELDTVAVPYSGKGSAKFNNLISTNYGQSDAMILPPFDLTSFSGTPYLSFKWAYARSDANFTDELFVLISKDCGLNWTQLFYKAGTQLATGPTQTTPYIPDSSTVWKSASINLFLYKTYNRVLLKLVNVTDGGNNLYIDHIYLGDVAANAKSISAEPYEISLFPNPAKESMTIYCSSTINRLSVTDIFGRQIYDNTSIGSISYNLNVGNIAKGIYFLRIISGEKIFNKLITVID